MQTKTESPSGLASMCLERAPSERRWSWLQDYSCTSIPSALFKCNPKGQATQLSFSHTDQPKNSPGYRPLHTTCDYSKGRLGLGTLVSSFQELVTSHVQRLESALWSNIKLKEPPTQKKDVKTESSLHHCLPSPDGNLHWPNCQAAF